MDIDLNKLLENAAVGIKEPEKNIDTWAPGTQTGKLVDNLTEDEYTQWNIVNKGYSIILDQFKIMDYKAYLLTEHWTHFRSEAIKNVGGKCQTCGKIDVPLHVHHNNYKNRGRETFNDVVVLCHDCHKKFHGRA